MGKVGLFQQGHLSAMLKTFGDNGHNSQSTYFSSFSVAAIALVTGSLGSEISSPATSCSSSSPIKNSSEIQEYANGVHVHIYTYIKSIVQTYRITVHAYKVHTSYRKPPSPDDI
ncbi:hypothetical protein V6N13_092210 [Hibiscus sabdariffa]|uniref:Uncharacterized protein n=1 Tax=Hibiscus sabdariffa TaxID=183260 RepID=A0ABR2CBN8_9ROSI